jgi:hypothetical protein
MPLDRSQNSQGEDLGEGENATPDRELTAASGTSFFIFFDLKMSNTITNGPVMMFTHSLQWKPQLRLNNQ